MAKNKPKIPKNNKFTIEKDRSTRPSFLVVEMIKNRKTHKIIPDKKKKENKESCRKKKYNGD